MAYIGRDIQYGVLDKQTLTGANGVKTQWTDLTYGVGSASSLLVSVGGVIQEPDVAYTASGTVLTFDEAPETSDTVYVVYLGKELSVATIADNSVTTAKIVDGSITQSKIHGDVILGGTSIGNDNVIRTNTTNITQTTVTFLNNTNGMTAGPVQINDGCTVDITDGSVWTIV